MSSSVQSAMGSLSKTQIWEDSCNRPNDVCSRPDALIHKASRTFKIHTSGHWSSWSERSSFIYGNSVHQTNHPDDSCYGPDVPSLWKLRVAKVRPSERGLIQERISAKFGKPIVLLSFRMPYVYRPNDA
jgi:hypothetical protein